MERLKRMPVPVLPTFVGALTLSNLYNGMGFPWVRHLTMWAATVMILVYLVKIIRYPEVCRKEYETVVPSSLYAGFTMVLMILGSYYYDYAPAAGRVLWFTGLAVHAVHILVFTWRNVIRQRSLETFVPSWFVTYNGIMVSCVVGGAMNAGGILKAVVYYGIIIYFILIPLMVWRLATRKIKPEFYHTMAVVLAPCSLCLVSLLNVMENPPGALVVILYLCVLVSLAFVIGKLPRFFSFPFSPGYAGMTFPMAIGTVASGRMEAWLAGNGQELLANVAGQLEGIQFYLTTMIIGYVLLKFAMMALRTERKA